MILLVSTYDLGRQPWGLASPAAWLRRAGFQVDCLDLAVDALDEARVRPADVIAFHLPMHTATRMALPIAARVRDLNPGARLGFYGLYAPMNARRLARLGAAFAIGGEFEAELVDAVRRAMASANRNGATKVPGGVHARGVALEPVVSLDRLEFVTPDRSGLPPPDSYARLDYGDGRLGRVGYTEASRGCKHLCRHCPIVPVYGGRFRVVPPEIVLADIRQQVEAGIEHLTFGDPDFLNGPRHAVAVARALHAEFPRLTYDVTVKIEHLIRQRELLGTLRSTGCLFVTSAVESVDDRVLEILDKGHTRADLVEATRLCREAGLVMHPTFVAFHPWITREGYLDLLDVIEALDLVEHVASVQLAIRLLIPAGSRLLELEEVRALVGPFDEELLVHPWAHPRNEVDALNDRVHRLVDDSARAGEGRAATFARVRAEAERAAGRRSLLAAASVAARAPIPYLTEPWYC